MIQIPMKVSGLLDKRTIQSFYQERIQGAKTLQTIASIQAGARRRHQRCKASSYLSFAKSCQFAAESCHEKTSSHSHSPHAKGAESVFRNQ